MPRVGLISLIKFRGSILLVEVATFLIHGVVNHCQVARSESNAVLFLIINGRFEFRAKHWLEFVLQKLRFEMDGV